MKRLLRQWTPPVLVDGFRRLRRPYAGGRPMDAQADLEFDCGGGLHLQLPAGHMLPVYRARYPLYDAFLPVLAAHLPRGHCVIDVGANCGDTVGAMAVRNPALEYICIEADAGFFAYMELNAARIRARFPELRLHAIQSLIGLQIDHASLEGTAGTKHAVTGTGAARSTRLDELAGAYPLQGLALLKSDVDGFDYDVILSGWAMLQARQPMVYFECQYDTAAQKSAYEDLLGRMRAIGYRDWCVFDNFGSLMLRTSDPGVLLDLIAYVWAQNQGAAARTVHYLDILAARAEHVRVVDDALREYGHRSLVLPA